MFHLFASTVTRLGASLAIALLFCCFIVGNALGQANCSAPGIQVLADPAGDHNAAAGTSKQDVLSVSIAEPGSLSSTLVFTMKVADLSAPLPINAFWKIYFNVGATVHFVEMSTDELGVVSYNEGTSATNLDTTEGPISGSYTSDGTITLFASVSAVGNPAVGSQLTAISARTQTLIGVLGTGGLDHD